MTEHEVIEYQRYLDLKGTHSKSLGDKIESYISGFGQEGLLIVSKARGYERPKFKISYEFDKDQHSYLIENLIVVEEGSKLELIVDLSSAPNAQVNYFGKTRIVAKSGSDVKIVKIQRLEQNACIFDSSISVVDEGGVVELVELQLGGRYKAVAHESELLGRSSRSEMKSAYYGEDESKLDLSYTMTHGGKQTESVILAKGALQGAAKKVFRGNLYFTTGSSESVGREQEFVTLLSDRVVSDSFPSLMCSEDDVIGEHAASVGQVDEDKLFYLMSRGLSESDAKRLLIKASFEEIIQAVGDETLAALITSEVDRRLV